MLGTAGALRAQQTCHASQDLLPLGKSVSDMLCRTLRQHVPVEWLHAKAAQQAAPNKLCKVCNKA